MGGIDPLKPNVTLPSNKVPNDKGTPEETTPKPAKEPKTIPPPTLDEKKPGDSNYDKYVTQQIGLAEANQGNGSETLRALEIKKCMEGTPKFKAEAKLKEKLIYDLLELGFKSDQIIKLLSSLASPDDFNNRIICLLLPKSAKAMLDKGNSTEDTIDYLEKSQKQIERSQPKLLIQSGLSLKEIDSLIINVSKMVDEENIWFAIDILPELIDHGLTADDISLLLKDCITACNGNTVNSMFSCITGLFNIGLDKKDVIEIIRITYENTEGNPASSSPVYISHSTFILNLKSAFLSLFQGTKSITELPLKDQDGATLQSIISIYKSHGGKAGHGIYVLIPELIKARYNIDDIISLIELIKAKSGKQADLFYIELASRIKSGEQIESILQEYHSLWDLNITWINRFSKEARAEIISNRQNREPDGRPLAVVFLPKADHN